MLQVQLAQVNYRYGDNAYFPYSVGLLQAFAESDNALKNKVYFRSPIFLREDIQNLVYKMDGLDVLGLSCYLWNWNWNLAFAKAAKDKFPNAVIVAGGPQIPRNKQAFFAQNSFVDAVIENEGEVVFSSLLRELVSNKSVHEIQIDGLCTRSNLSAQAHEVKKNRIQDLDLIPSPYLSGIFDNLIVDHPYLQFQATQETHRGCPYSCTFCDWGSATMTKVRRFPLERLKAEFDWFGKNRIELLYNADANYGLFPEDVQITQAMIEAKKIYGYPKKFRAAYAKNSNDRVFQISRELEDEEMCKGVTLSFQSMDSSTLDLIKRRNMKINDFRELITSYRQSKIPTYTELILGLPGETIQSFVKGIDTLLDAGQHDSLSIYHAMLLENAEMNDVKYKELHGIKSQKIPLLLLHGTIETHDIVEYYDVATETLAMPSQDWVNATVYAWGIQAFHCLNLTQAVSVGLRYQYKIEYSTFYQDFFAYVLKSDNYLGELFRDLKAMAISVNKGEGSFDLGDRSFGNIMWPVEEILFLKTNREDFWEILTKFILEQYSFVPVPDVIDLVNYQRLSLRNVQSYKGTGRIFSANWHSYIDGLLENRIVQLERSPCFIQVTENVEFDNVVDYAREVVWYGRKGSTLRQRNIRVSYPQ